MWNAVSDKDANDSDFSKYLFHYDYAAQQTGFVQPYADSTMDNEQVGEEVYISDIGILSLSHKLILSNLCD